jgi:hypothetical protein
MNRRKFLTRAGLGSLALASLPTLATTALANDDPEDQHKEAHGQGSYLLGPGLPTVFAFDRESMTCNAAWGTLGAPGPGPFSDPAMGLENVNFGMIVYSLKVRTFQVHEHTLMMTGRARSITTVNEDIMENAVYTFMVSAVDGGSRAKDSFSMSMRGEGLLFDGHTFASAPGAGLTQGQIVIR